MLDRVAELVSGFGVNGRRLRQAIARLTEHPQSLDGLVRDCALPRRTVEALLHTLGKDLDGGMLRPELIPLYRKRFGYDQLMNTEPADPLAPALALAGDLIARMAQDIQAAPVAKRALDHVSATAETIVRRALWADATFDLAGAHLLCVGDHDLTSLALCAVNSELSITVVDVDERLLEYIEYRAVRDNLNLKCLYADFRFGLPESVLADLILTDPPYTPEGVQLFLGRGLQGLRDRVNGRLVLAYGFSPLHPALGLKVQAAIAGLDLVLEAVLPAFNRYHGAQAVGSASDLYVCRPTARTWQILDKRLSNAVTNLYTHGTQSQEAQTSTPDETVTHHLIRAATDGGAAVGDDASVMLVGGGWPVSLGQVLTGGLPARVTARKPTIAAVICADDPGPWLLRTLLAINADRLAILVPNNHPDLANATAQQALIDLIAPKYSLRLLRSTPGPRFAIVEAMRAKAHGARRGADLSDCPADDGLANGQWLTARPADDGLATGARLAADLLSRAHGKVGKVLREGLVRLSANRPQGALTKNEARALIAGTSIVPAWLDARLIDLPRYAIRTLIELAS